MTAETGYLIIDIGTGNVRVAITNQTSQVLHLERDNVRYVKDELYPDAVYFEPNELWGQIMMMAEKAVSMMPHVNIRAITASSQREGIVLLDDEGKSLIGLSNHDHRGREWEDMIDDKHYVYSLTGRYPTSLFSALKVIGIKNRRPEIYSRFAKMLSISDWAQYQLCGIESYEHSQASETILYDVERKCWSKELCDIFGINMKVLPELRNSGTILGKVSPAYAERLKLNTDTVVIVGGADTQLAIKSTKPSVGDIVIVSGTTTPIVKIVNDYVTDIHQRTWTNRHINADNFILEANAGVTGLNYQRLKEIFYPNENYDVIEKELAKSPNCHCVASLGSLVAEEKSPIIQGGFVFSTPVSHELSRASFVRATLWDIACSIKENYEILCSVSSSIPGFIWACGGGFQSKVLGQYIANLTRTKVLIREGYQQASVVGASLVCNEALGIKTEQETAIEELQPQVDKNEHALYNQWKDVRSSFRQNVMEEMI
ncbi:FGGY-family carbohydrate kinase [Segetibacter aerophilus]|uniref:Putative sugar kinase YoaC n=1 Tax=Segetibacter aerophilus TaxID=670293 RepID=A0A512BGU3_9BACT|nr:FGGY family carbohydrate kinase [Segetibacter aerophilus]GEO11184.1 putative sugar kinase YoaC [Segetibacter aerophilus]